MGDSSNFNNLFGSVKNFMNKTASEVKTSVIRANQLAGEKLGISERTELDAQFEALEARAELNGNYTQKILSAVKSMNSSQLGEFATAFFKENLEGSKMKNTPYLLMSNVFYQTGSDVGATTELGNCLVNCSNSFAQLHGAHQDMCNKIDDEFLLPMTRYLSTDIVAAKKERNILNNMRIDMDAAKSTLKKCAPEKAAEALAVVRQKEALFDSQCEKTRAMFNQLDIDQGPHMAYLRSLVKVLLEYHERSTQLLKELGGGMGKE